MLADRVTKKEITLNALAHTKECDMSEPLLDYYIYIKIKLPLIMVFRPCL